MSKTIFLNEEGDKLTPKIIENRTKFTHVLNEYMFKVESLDNIDEAPICCGADTTDYETVQFLYTYRETDVFLADNGINKFILIGKRGYEFNK